MAIWLTALIAGLIGIGFVIKRGTAGRQINAGEVSESWLREQRAEKQER
jgi:hypothetical protein